MKIGKYTLHIVESGSFALDGGAMFGVIPKTLWSRTYSTDDLNRVKIVARNLLLVSDSKKILFDTGMGQKWSKKFVDMYDINFEQYSLNESLKSYHLTPGDITDVILTHLHFDHTGGSTILDGNELIPAFPNAAYYVQEDNLKWANQQNERDKASYLKDNYEPLLKHGILKTMKEDERFFDDEIELLRVNGHTYGQQLIKLTDTENTLLYGADLFPLASSIPLPYIMAYDLQPLITLQEKKTFLPAIVEENWKIFFEHDPKHIMATVATGEKGYTIKEYYDTF